MITKSKVKVRAHRKRAVDLSPRGIGSTSSSDQAETENVEYFLRALNQISLALHALGYIAEGEALAHVKVDLRQRIFSSPEKLVEIQKVLH